MDRLHLIGQLKATIRKLNSDGRLSVIEYTRLNGQLDELLIESFTPDVPLDTLIQSADKTLANFDFAPLRTLLHKEHKATVLERRKLALEGEEHTLDLSDLISGFDCIPLQPLTWSKKTGQFRIVVDFFKSDPTIEEVIAVSENLFLHQQHWSPMERYPHLKEAPIRDLLAEELVQIDQLEVLGDSFARITHRIESDLALLNNTGISDPGLSGDNAYRILRSRAEEGLPENLQRSLVMWQGLQWYELLSLWYKNGKLTDIKSILLLAVSGFDPITEKRLFNTWLENRCQYERSQYLKFREELKKESLYYWMSWICSSKEILGDDIERLWWPVIQALGTAKNNVEETVKEPVDTKPIESDQQEVSPFNNDASNAELISQDTSSVSSKEKVDEEQNQLELVPEDSIASLAAPDYGQSEEDAYVARTSTWSNYLKPFLQENWLAVVGMGFLLAALFLLSGFTGASAYFTEISLVIVLAFLGISFSKISSFLFQSEKEGASRRATELFALICIYTLPFNILMALQIWFEHGGWGRVIAGILILGYLFGLFPLLLRWISGPFDQKLLRPLLYGNTVLLIPFISDIPSVGESSFFPHSIPFVSLVTLAIGLRATASAESSTQRFYFSAYLGQTLLLIIIALGYFRFLPGIGEFALFIGLIAFGIVFFTENSTSKNIFSGGLSLLANLLAVSLAVNEPRFLPATLVLSISTWWVMAKHIGKPWCYEWIYFHIFALVIALHVLIGNDVSSAPLYFSLALAIIAGLLFERLISSQLRLLTFLGFVYPILPLAFWITDAAVPPPWILVLSILSGVYNYVRLGNNTHKTLWLTNILICTLIPLLWILEQGYLFLSIVAFAWTFTRWIPKNKLPELNSSVLWLLLLLPIPFLFIDPSPWSIYAGVGFHIIAGLVAARRSRSALPVYLVLGVLAIVGNALLRIEFDIAPESGIATGSLAMGFAVFAFYLQKRALWQHRTISDTLFGYSFAQKNFLALPFFHAGWLLLGLSLFSIVQVSIGQDIISNGFDLLLVIGLSINVLSMLALGFLRPYPIAGSIVPLPLLLLAWNFLLPLPTDIRWIVGMSLLVGFHFLLDRKYMRNSLVNYVLTKPLRLYTNLFAAIVPLLAFLGWPELMQSDLFLLAAYITLTILFTHFYAVPLYSQFSGCIALVHGIALALVIMWNIFPVREFVYWMLISVAALLLIVRSIAVTVAAQDREESTAHDSQQQDTAHVYLRIIPGFLIIASVGVVLFLCSHIIDAGQGGITWWDALGITWWHALIGLLTIHACWNANISAIPKWIVSALLVATFFDDVLLLLLGSLQLFTLSEYLAAKVRKSGPLISTPILTGIMLVASGLSQVSWIHSIFIDSGVKLSPAVQLFILVITGLAIATIHARGKVVSPQNWFNATVQGLIYSSLPLGFYGYYLLADSSIIFAICLAILSIILIHLFFAFKKSPNYVHLIFAHLIAPWLLYGFAAQLDTANYIASLPGVLFGAFSILFLISYSLENTLAFKVYTQRVQSWLVTISIAFLVVLLTDFPASFASNIAFLVLPMVHLGFRRHSNLVAYSAKLVASTATGLALVDDHFTALVVSVFIFSGWEFLTWLLDRIQKLQFRGDQGSEFDFIQTLQWSLVAIILFHLFSNIFLNVPSQNILLYALLPLFYLVHIRRDREYLSYAVLAVFVYANGFLFYELQDLVSRYYLTVLHLTSLSFIFSIAVFSGLRRAMR